MTKTIGEWILHYQERYGRHYRILIQTEGCDTRVYYWWDGIPRDILNKPAKRVWSRYYTEEHGIRERELEIVY